MKSSAGVQTQPRRIDHEFEFQNFNFCGPSDGKLISLRELANWAFEARRGDRVAGRKFANSMCWTMRSTTMDAYLRTHRLRIVSYADWFLSKAVMFVRILLDSDPGTPCLDRLRDGLLHIPDYSDAWIGPDHPLFELKPENDELYDWHGLVRAISEHPENRERALLEWLKRPGPALLPTRKELPATARRNNLIRQAQADRHSGREICEILDRNGIPTTKPMQKNDVFQWTVAWDDPDFNRNIQTMLSKTKVR